VAETSMSASDTQPQQIKAGDGDQKKGQDRVITTAGGHQVPKAGASAVMHRAGTTTDQDGLKTFQRQEIW